MRSKKILNLVPNVPFHLTNKISIAVLLEQTIGVRLKKLILNYTYSLTEPAEVERQGQT